MLNCTLKCSQEEWNFSNREIFEELDSETNRDLNVDTMKLVQTLMFPMRIYVYDTSPYLHVEKLPFYQMFTKSGSPYN